MSLERTDNLVLLKTPGVPYYWVGITLLSSGVFAVDVVDVDAPVLSVSDGYVPLVASNGLVYRWSLGDPVDTGGGVFYVPHLFTLSPDQHETTATEFRLKFGDDWYKITLREDSGAIFHWIELALPVIASLNNFWPASVPLPCIDYTGSARNTTVVSRPESGYLARRFRFTKTYVELNVTWMLKPEEYDSFRSFYAIELSNGTALFEMELRYPKQSILKDWGVRFSGGYIARSLDGMWEVAADLDLVQDLVISPGGGP